MWKAVLIIALIVVVSIAALTVGGLRGPGDPGKAVAGIEDWVGDMLSAPLPASDLRERSGGCRRTGSEITLPADRLCTIDISEGGTRVRKGDIAVTSGVIDIAFTPPSSDEYSTARDGTIAGSDRFELDIRKEGGTLTLTCQTDGGCVIRVARR